MAYIRKTTDIWEVEQHYGQGWEVVNTETTRQDGRRSLKEYLENMGQYPTRLVKRRERPQP